MANPIGPWLHGSHWKAQYRLGNLIEVDGTDSDTKDRLVKLNAQGQAVRAGAGEAVLGVGRQPSRGTRGVCVQTDGVTDLLVDGAVAIGDQLKADAQGRGVATSTDGDEVGAVALEAVNAGGTIQVLVTPFSHV